MLGGVPRTDPAASDDFDAFAAKHHQALDTFMTGDPEPLKALFSRSDHVTLANPFGPPQRGRADVAKTMEAAAGHYRDGRAIRFEEVARYVTSELAYIVEVEHLEAKVGGSDEVTPVSLRCTTVLRREDENWMILHRHADPITATRPAESIVGS
jgi:ketosteroid isomerase-like protein